MSAVTKWEHNLCKNRAKFLTTNFATQGKTIFIRVTSCAACVFLNNNFKWTTHTTKTKQHNLPLDSLLILYSCCIFRIKGEVVEGFKNLSSTTNFSFGVRGSMDTRQIAALTNHHIISLLFLILSEVARRLGVPIVLTPGSDQTSDPEAGQAEVDQSAASGTGPICSYGCAVPGCHQWCRHNHTPHCRHRCLDHSWE